MKFPMSRQPRFMHRSGLTLLELMVVLIILAIVATVAIRNLEPQIASQRLQSAASLLQQIRLATVGPEQKYQVDGTPLVTGFVADVGSLPVETTSLDGDSTGFVLTDLWDEAGNLAANYPFQFRTGPDPYQAVRLPCGWRGPYLQLPVGTEKLVDPWGRPPELETTTDGQVTAVRIEIPESAEFANQAELDVQLDSGKVSVSGTVLLDDTFQGTVKAVMLVPHPGRSLTTLAVLDDEDEQANGFLFRNVPIGLRAIVVEADGRRQVRYVQVPHQGLSVVFDFRKTLQ